MMLPKRWRHNAKIQTIFLLLAPFFLDYLLLTQVFEEVRFPVIPFVFYVGMHSVFLTDYLNFSFPAWINDLRTKEIFLTAAGGGLAGVFTLGRDQYFLNFLCGASALVIVLINISYLIEKISMRQTLKMTSFCLFALCFIEFNLRDWRSALVQCVWAVAMFFQSYLVPADEYRFSEEW